jgi:hypothetical protein
MAFFVCSLQVLAAEGDFQITGIRKTGDGQLEIEWTSAPGRWYRLERATGLGPDDFRIVAPKLEANPPSNTLSDTVGSALCYFYRVAATGLPVPYPQPVIEVAGVSEAPVNAMLHLDGDGSFSPIGQKIVHWHWTVEGPSAASDVARAPVAWASCP